jgi:hypothetical protein
MIKHNSKNQHRQQLKNGEGSTPYVPPTDTSGCSTACPSVTVSPRSNAQRTALDDDTKCDVAF